MLQSALPPCAVFFIPCLIMHLHVTTDDVVIHLVTVDKAVFPKKTRWMFGLVYWSGNIFAVD